MKRFNPLALAEILDLEEGPDSNLVNEIISDYLIRAPELLSQIETGHRDGDFAVLERSAHSLKSSSALLGLEIVADAALVVESEARDQRFDQAQYNHLKTSVHEVANDQMKFGVIVRCSRNRFRIIRGVLAAAAQSQGENHGYGCLN